MPLFNRVRLSFTPEVAQAARDTDWRTAVERLLRADASLHLNLKVEARKDNFDLIVVEAIRGDVRYRIEAGYTGLDLLDALQRIPAIFGNN